jgi:hypothetical protein
MDRLDFHPLVLTETILAQNAEVIRALGKRVIGDIIEIGRRLFACLVDQVPAPPKHARNAGSSR